MLHIHNGDSAANVAKQSALPGEHLVWRESLVTGPTPSGLADAEWRSLRAAHLSEGYGADKQECEKDLLRQEENLNSYTEHDEVVLWFEHDLFCQLHLLYLLDRFSQRDLGTTRLSLVCIGEFPGRENFRGLGELTPDELASLFPKRRSVTAAQLSLAVSAWQAYRSADPTEIARLLQEDTSVLPFLHAALGAHLQRFPSTKNGLSRIESQVLQLIHDGVDRFTDLFQEFQKTESVYGLGDAQVWLALRRMSVGQLIAVEGIGNEHLETQLLMREVVENARFGLTWLAEPTLGGESDFVVLNGIDLWLGGVHLHGTTNATLWRWDERAGTVVLFTPRL